MEITAIPVPNYRVTIAGLLLDLRHATRQAITHIGLSVTLVLVLSIGIGACTTIYSLVDELLFRPIKIDRPKELLAVTFIDRSGNPVHPNLSAPYATAIAQQSVSFRALTTYSTIISPYRVGDRSDDHGFGQLIAGNYFVTLGLRPHLGRLLAADDDSSSAGDIPAVISYSCWQRSFGGSPNALGQIIFVNKTPLTIVGVAPSSFNGLNSIAQIQFWVPMSAEKRIAAHSVYELVGRLAPGYSQQQSAEELGAIMRNMVRSLGGHPPVGYERYGVLPAEIRPHLDLAAFGVWGPQRGGRNNVTKLAIVLFLVVGLVFCVACSNSASLLFIRGLQRRREIAVRLALGASRYRILRQLVAETAILTSAAALLGVIFSYWWLQWLLSLRTGAFTFFFIENHLDFRIIAFAIILAGVTTSFFGLFPLLQVMRLDASEVLKQESTFATANARSLFLRNSLIVVQIATGLTLVLSAGVCVRSFAKLLAVDPGFNTRRILVANATFDQTESSNFAPRSLVTDALNRIAALPGVKDVSLCDHPPLSGNTAQQGISTLDDYHPAKNENVQVSVTRVGPAYFKILGIPLIEGRAFDRNDVVGRPAVVLVNRSFVERYWPNQNPIGKRIDGAEVVGVASNSRSQDIAVKPAAEIYYPILQSEMQNVSFLILTERDIEQIAPTLKRELSAISSNLVLTKVESLHTIVMSSLAGRRVIISCLSGLSIVALGMAAIGLYSVIARTVAERTREIGIRKAIGANDGEIVGLILRQATKLVAIGVSIGLTAAVGASHALAAVLYETSPTDPLIYIVVTTGVLALAFIACWIPARNAVRVDPVVALRVD